MRTPEEFNKLVAGNLVKYRKHNNLTQLQLAEKLSYSDKAISKWERGECLPDFYVLCQIAELYGISVSDLISTRQKPKSSFKGLREVFGVISAVAIVWLLSIIAYFVLSLTTEYNNLWYSFIYAIPVTALVVFIFSCSYKRLFMQLFSLSAFIWTVILSLYLTFKWATDDLIMIYYIGIPLQLIILFIYLYNIIKKHRKEKSAKKQE